MIIRLIDKGKHMKIAMGAFSKDMQTVIYNTLDVKAKTATIDYIDKMINPACQALLTVNEDDEDKKFSIPFELLILSDGCYDKYPIKIENNYFSGSIFTTGEKMIFLESYKPEFNRIYKGFCYLGKSIDKDDKDDKNDTDNEYKIVDE